MRVNCNISAIIANNQLGKAQNAVDIAIERLSSGLKINHAEDDAAGMAISKKMHTQIKAVEQASRNTSDGISVVQTAESALGEIENMLQRARELAVQAADGTYSDGDRAAIQNEIDQLKEEINRVSTDTEYNTMPLLDGTLGRKAYANVDGVEMFNMSLTMKTGEYSFSVTSQAERATMSITVFSGTVSAQQAGSVKINGSIIDISEGDTFTDVYDKIMDACNFAGLDIEGDPATGSVDLFSRGYGENEEISIIFDETETAALFGLGKENRTAGKDCEISLGNGFSSTASVVTDGTVVTVKDINDFEMRFEVPGDATIAQCTFKVTDLGIMNIQVGANENQQIGIDIPQINAHTLGLDNLNIGSDYAAGISIARLDEAISQVSSIRSKLGAYQNRLETTEEGLGSYNENITSALSRIEDCDMAEEMTEDTSQNVITQAATSILAQANERPQTVLQLLQ